MGLKGAGCALSLCVAIAGCDDSPGASTPPDAGADAAPVEDDGLARYVYEGEPGPETLFQHGVASGDPLPDAVILWTRVSPAEDGPVEVFFEIALEPTFARRTGVGTFTTDATRDFTVKVDADGLEAGTTYYYRFQALGRASPIGRTRAAPLGPVERVRLGVVSCASYGHGWFHAYRHLALRADLDAIVHLGDYIYEYESGRYGDARAVEPDVACSTLAEYRERYAYYHLDPDLRAVHRQHPFIVVWDDHEFSNNAWPDGAQGHDEAEAGPWPARRAAAEQAYFEWLPIREGEPGRIWRTLRFGDLVDLILLDTRMWGRDEVSGAEIKNPERTLLGFDQEAWLFDQLTESTARWRVIGQQVMMGQLKSIGKPNAEGGGNALNPDQWDGYQGTRNRLFETLRTRQIDNVVVLSGDIHSSWAIELTEDPNNPDAYDPATGEGALAVELVAPGVTSPGLPFLPPRTGALLRQQNPHIKWLELEHRGYVLLDVTRERAQGAWFHFDHIDGPEATEAFVTGFETGDGTSHLVEVAAPAPPRDDPPPLAP